MRPLTRIFKWLFLMILGLGLLVWLLLATERGARERDRDSEAAVAVKEYDLDQAAGKYDFLMETFGRYKILPKGFELQSLLALSHYPELKEVPIRFLIQPAKLQLSARPDPWSLLLPWEARTYLVIISNDTGRNNDPILLPLVPFNEQVGIIGHELAHISSYIDKEAIYFVSLGYKYAFRFEEFAPGFERATDRRAIAHGLGYQLYDFAFFVRKAFGQTQQQIQQERGGLYMSPPEIAEEMAKFDFYTASLNPPQSYFEN